jgi:hypothetical protein
MLLRPEYLSQNLDRPLPTKDGGTLRTIGQAVDYMTGIGKQRELRTHWQRIAKLILAKEDVLTVSRALELALFMDAKSRQNNISPRRKRGGNEMAWIVGSVQDVSLEDSLPIRPGFDIQQEGSSPTLTLVFEDRKTAEDCATAMKRILDRAVGIRGRI